MLKASVRVSLNRSGGIWVKNKVSMFFSTAGLVSQRVWGQVFLWLFIAFGLGIICNEAFRPVFWVSAAGSGLSFCCVWVLRFRADKISAVVLFFFLGMLYCRAFCYLPREHIYNMFRYQHYRDAVVQGRVRGDVKRSGLHGRQTFYFDVERISQGKGRGIAAEGKVLVRLFQEINVRPGGRLRIHGKLHRPHDFQIGGRMSYRTFLRRRGVYLVLTAGKRSSVVILNTQQDILDSVLLFREHFKQAFDEYLPPFESRMMKAVLLGDRAEISRRTRDLFAKTGTAHILAISGLHMGIIVLVFLTVLGCLPVPLKGRYILAVMFLAAYVPLAGGRVSVVRSAVMVSVFLCSFIVERRFCSFNALGLAGLMILLIHPLDVYFIGFQLSFLAVGALILFTQPVYAFLKTKFPAFLNSVIQMFCVSFAAWLGVLGLVLYAFGMITPIGLIANLAAVSFMAGIIALGLLLAMFSLLEWACLARVIALDLQVLIRWLMYCVDRLGQIPYGHFSRMRVGAALCLLYYMLLILLAGWIAWRGIKRPPEIRRPF